MNKHSPTLWTHQTRSTYAHETVRCACGDLMRPSVEPLTGETVLTCGSCRRAVRVPRTGGMAKCADCGAERLGMRRGATRVTRCPQYCAQCCKRHASADGHECDRTRELDRAGRYNALASATCAHAKQTTRSERPAGTDERASRIPAPEAERLAASRTLREAVASRGGGGMKPYYEADGITLYHGDCRDVLFSCSALRGQAAMITDPPYGISYSSGQRRRKGLARSIEGDATTERRDFVLGWWQGGRALVFGSWKMPRPAGTRMVLFWDTGGALGMGDLSMPWRNSTQEIYVIGRGFRGRRTGNVLRFPPVQSTGRDHPNEKPVDLMTALVSATPDPVILDPFAGVGSTLRAAKNLGRRAVGIELDERYCEVAAERLSQQVLPLATDGAA